MTCGNCGYRIPEDSVFCQYCGVRITGSPTPGSAPSPAPARKNSAPKKPRRTAWVALLVLALALLGGLVWFWAIPGMKYMQAKDQLNSGDYDGAYAAFCALGDFADAPQQSLEARYQKAVALRAQGDFDDANPIFRELLDYRDSSALIHEHNYVMTVIKEATCTTAGEKRGICDCGAVTATEQIRATGHNYAAATCTEPRTCKNCGATDGSDLGHTNEWICERCGWRTRYGRTWYGLGNETTSKEDLPKGKYYVRIIYEGQGTISVAYRSNGQSKLWLAQNESGPFAEQYILTLKNDAKDAYFTVEAPKETHMWRIEIITEEYYKEIASLAGV